jgi:hypothetical protein
MWQIQDMVVFDLDVRMGDARCVWLPFLFSPSKLLRSKKSIT